MPTVDELPAATSVSDTDEMLVSQTDIARKATRAQLLAGVQPALALPQGSLLGRISSGTGAPETILIGANLTVANGIISAPGAFDINALPAAGAPQAGDLVAIAQGGQNAAETYSAFMGGLSTIAGIDGSNLLTNVTDGIGTRRVADAFSDAITLESFGGIGDGVTDNTSALLAALATGRPVRFDARVYIVNGPIFADIGSSWLGVVGGTVIRRQQVIQSQPWIEIAGPSLSMDGIIFDAAKLAAGDSPVVQIDAVCTVSKITRCAFINAWGPVTGSGLSINCGTNSNHQLVLCQAHSNALSGLAVGGGGTIVVDLCEFHGNGACGVQIAAESSCRLIDNICSSNNIGVSVGNWQAAAPQSPTSVDCVIVRNTCAENTLWGIAANCYGALIASNCLVSDGTQSAGGGMLAHVALSRVAGNQVSGGNIGIDASTSWGSQVAGNHISGTQIAISCAGCVNVSITSNYLISNVWSVDIPVIAASLTTTLTGPVTVSANWIGFTIAQGGGVWAHDGVLGVCVSDNDFNGWGSATVGQALWLHTDQAVVSGNRWNNQPRFSLQSSEVAGKQALVLADLADEGIVLTASAAIQSLLTSHQIDTLGQITFIRVAAGGSGYTNAQIAIAGTGRGAAASAIVAAGGIVCIIVTNPGSGYGEVGTNASVTITGDGTGASAVAFVGAPVIEGRRLRLACNCAVVFALAGSVPQFESWTGFNSTVPAMGAVELEGSFGSWRAVSFPPVDYLQPTGDGGTILTSVSGGDVTLRPSSGGALHLGSGAEPDGCTSSVGRGAPTGFVAAPPGSDFRNLNGGAGNTFWVKQTGIDTNGWHAIA
jgi:hypothetical protein